jgi:DNA-binding beta-propeller fold protein YncE
MYSVKKSALIATLLLWSACTLNGSAVQTIVTTQTAPVPTPTTVVATTTSTTSTTTTTTTLPPTTTTTTIPASSGLTLVQIGQVWGDISPKSVVATGTGKFFAQNMMYRHTVTVYDSEGELLETIEDSVDLGAFGFEVGGESYKGSPVEAAMTSDGAFAYVSNYEMYGSGYGNPGGDGCGTALWDNSYVYRIPTDTLEIDQVISVGPVPKFLAVTPDDTLLLVSNWCGHDLSVVDIESGLEVQRLPMGRHPRGIAITSDSSTAYVAVMGSRDIAKVDLDTFAVTYLEGVGSNPRHLVINTDDSFMYVTLNGESMIAQIDLATEEVVAKIRTGSTPRSMAISDDGLSLYVVNYNSATMSKVDAVTMEVLQTESVPEHPIGITFDPLSRQVWVSSYVGALTIFQETEQEG